MYYDAGDNGEDECQVINLSASLCDAAGDHYQWRSPDEVNRYPCFWGGSWEGWGSTSGTECWGVGGCGSDDVQGFGTPIAAAATPYSLLTVPPGLDGQSPVSPDSVWSGAAMVSAREEDPQVRAQCDDAENIFLNARAWGCMRILDFRTLATRQRAT